jgi:hypothetical protein
MLMASDQLRGLGEWYNPATWFQPSPTEQQRRDAAWNLTNLKIWNKQLKINRAKLDAARNAGGGGTPEYTEASHQQRVAEANFDTAHGMAIDAYNAAVAAGKVRPLDNGRASLAGIDVVLEIAFGAALVVAAIWAAPALIPFLGVCLILVAAFAAFTLTMDALSRLLPAVAVALAPISNMVGTVAASGAAIVLAVVGFLIFSKLRGASA